MPAGSGAAERRLRTGSARGQRPASFPGRAGAQRTERGSSAALGDLGHLSAQPSHLTRSRGIFVEPTAPCVRRSALSSRR